jgi:FkbH-like protein
MTSPAKEDCDAGPALREAIVTHLQAGRMWPAVQCARQMLERQPGVRTDRFLRNALESIPAESIGFKRFSVALLSSYSIGFTNDSLVAKGFASGLKIEIYEARFGTFRQEVLDAGSGLYAAAPDAVILAVEREAWHPVSASSAAAPIETADAIGREIAALAKHFRARSNAALLIHNFPWPAFPPAGIAEAETGNALPIARLNDFLARFSKDLPNMYVVDCAGLVNRYGALNWFDDRMRLYARAPIAQGMQSRLAAEYVKFFRALSGLTKKCLVLDLDNTLWGGIVGEDGLAGIKLGTDYPGSAFVEFQQCVLALHERGIILAIASKNNPADVEEVFAGHPFMVLKPNHFSATQVSWQPKTGSLVEIARRLNIGLDHVVFADDNPFECEQVREALPMVTVIQLPTEPERYVAALLQDGWFDTLTTSDEDRRRGQLYQQRDEAETLRAASGSLEAFYRELSMEVSIASVDRSTLARAAQLTQKTNQLNATTRRYSDADVLQRAGDPDWLVRTIAVRDRFGDNGIVGLVMARVNGAALEIDTFLLSCRVIGRTIETAMLAALCNEARRRALSSVTGVIVPTPKNAPVRDLYERHGFAKLAEDADGSTRWSCNLAESAVASPDWLRVEELIGQEAAVTQER